MTHKMETALTVKEAKKLDYTFDINAQKAEVVTDWVTEYGYSEVKMHRIGYYSNEVYQLELDGEMSEVWYAIFKNGDEVAFEPVHWHE